MSLRTFLQRVADLAMSGEFATAALYYAHPLAVYERGDLRVEETRADTILALADREAGARAVGGVAIVILVESLHNTEDGATVATATRNFLDADEVMVRRSRVRYFCRTADNDLGWTIEMLELIDVGFPNMPLTAMKGEPRH